MVSVNWNEIFSKNHNDVVRFANGTLSFRNFKKTIKDKTARTEINKLENFRSGDERRNLARRACRRRKVNLITL